MTVKFDTVLGTQKIFRILLDAMARPGKINTLPDIDLEVTLPVSVYSVLPLLTLSDHEVSFCLLHNGNPDPEFERLAGYLERVIGSRSTEVNGADFLVVYGGNSGDAVLRAKRGTLEYPDASATVIYEVSRLDNEQDAPLNLELTGPGVDGTKNLSIDGLDEEEIDRLEKTREEFPLGPDVILIDKTGRVACLPRSTKIKIRS